MHVDCNTFCHQLSLFVEWTFEDGGSVLEKSVGPQKKMWSTGFYSRIFLSYNDW